MQVEPRAKALAGDDGRPPLRTRRRSRGSLLVVENVVVGTIVPARLEAATPDGCTIIVARIGMSIAAAMNDLLGAADRRHLRPDDAPPPVGWHPRLL